MAAPIAHIFLAVQALSGPLLNKFNEKEFLIGTSFPDIRYLNVIERDNTHFKNVTINDIKNETNSFKAGMLFHSFVDEKREEYIVQNNFYENLPRFKFMTQSLKFAEDQILMPLFDIKPYSSYFYEILDEEYKFNISNENLIKWHKFLQEYFNNKISCENLVMRYFDLNKPNSWRITRLFFSFYYARRINKSINKIVNNEHYKKLILDFYLNFNNKYL